MLVPPGADPGDYAILDYTMEETNTFAFNALNRRLKVIGIDLAMLSAAAAVTAGQERSAPPSSLRQARHRLRTRPVRYLGKVRVQARVLVSRQPEALEPEVRRRRRPRGQPHALGAAVDRSQATPRPMRAFHCVDRLDERPRGRWTGSASGLGIRAS